MTTNKTPSLQPTSHPQRSEGSAVPASTLRSQPPPYRLHPHEYTFQLFVLITWLRLVRASGFSAPLSLLYFSFLLLAVLLIYLSTRIPQQWPWRLRLLYYPIVMNVAYMNMAPVVAAIHRSPLLDTSLRRIDHLLIGENLSLRLEPFVRPLFTEPLSFCYMLFIPYLTFSMLVYFLGPLPLLKRFYLGLFTIYGFGFLGYTFVPAAGPYLAMTREFHVPFTGWYFTRWNAAMVHFGSNGVDVFPSLHCAISSYMLFFDRWYKKWRFRLYAVPCVGLWFSTIYLRYHYFIDVLGGFALSGCVLYFTRRYQLQRDPA
jgi:membrane-associated phospholipid phosphatase